MIRPGRDADADGFVHLVTSCWLEYPGCVVDIDGESPELRRLASYAAGRGGAVWASEADGAIVGMICAWPLADGAWEIGKVYVARAHRGGGLAHRLLTTAEQHARAQGATRLRLWSDTRFDRAHRFYEKRDYVRAGPLRVVADKSNTIEFAYAKPLAGSVVERLDAAGAASAVGSLARLLVACVDGGASISFLPPLAPERAAAFWRNTAAGVARGEKLLFAAWLDGALAGTVTLDLAMPPNQPHRGDVAKMMVHPAARRRGLARLLLAAAEAAAREAGRSLLVLDTREGDHAEALYRSAGWIAAGRIPGYALNADGLTAHATVFYYKSLAD